jgi:diguanylate cyclase
MEQAADRDPTFSTAKAQRLRLGRILGGAASYALTTAIVIVCWMFGFLDGERLLHFVAAVVTINVVAIMLVLTNWNLRFADPSMTGMLIVASLAPSVYVMYYVTEPMIRAAFLLMATVAMLFGVLAFDFRRMLALGGAVLASYLGILLALYHWAPERLDHAYRSGIGVCLCHRLDAGRLSGKLLAKLRESLRSKNHDLLETMAELEDLATRDPLTRLPNRRTAMMQLNRELNRSDRRETAGDTLCVALLDVDHFKRVNDDHGHQAGDDVLRLLGSAMSNAIRQGDFIARFGGEEFLLILPETTLEGGRIGAQRLCDAIAGHTLSERLPADTPITVSIGLAAHEPHRRIEETLGFADKALYEAKARGRNQVVAWDSDARPCGPAKA